MDKDRLRKSLKREVRQRIQPKKNAGKTTKLPIGQWIQRVLELNEEYPSNEKLTDPMIVTNLVREFTRSLSLVRKFEKAPYMFSSERSRYNRKSTSPIISWRYSETGFPVVGKGEGCRALSISECRKKAFDLKKLDPRVFTEEEIEYAHSLADADEGYTDFLFPSQEDLSKFSLGTILFGVRDRDVIPIDILERKWLHEN